MRINGTLDTAANTTFLVTPTAQANLDFIYAANSSAMGRVAAGSALQVPRINAAGTGWEFTTPDTPRSIYSTDFSALARLTKVVTDTAQGTVGVAGVSLQTQSMTAGSVSVRWDPLIRWGYNGVDIFSGSPTAYGHFGLFYSPGNDYDVYFGLGVVTVATAGITFTPRHAGFKVTRRSSGTQTLYATQADGTTETVSPALTTLTNYTNGEFDVRIVVNGTSSISYYFRQNGGAWSSATTLSTNMPTGGSGANVGAGMMFALSNRSGTGSYNEWIASAFTYVQ